MSDVTRILGQIDGGDPSAAEKLLPLVYAELRKLAGALMTDERDNHTLQATALVHEAYLRLVDGPQAQRWNSRGHFFVAAAEAMRRILVESARRKKRLRHGGEERRLQKEIDQLADQTDNFDLLAIDELLDQLADNNQTVANVVKLRCFVGFSIPEVAESLGIPRSTAYGHWAYAKAWLLRELRKKSS